MAQDAPIAMKVFGSPSVPRPLKLHFMRTLVLSKLLFNLHVAVPSARDMKALNTAYMRVLRRIHGDVRFSAGTVLTDILVRTELEQPSVDCLLVRARLRYMARIIRSQPRDLMALLHLRSRSDTPLPWVELLTKDIDTLRLHKLIPRHFPDFVADAGAWHALMRAAGTWEEIVGSLHFYESLCDSEAARGGYHSLGGLTCNIFLVAA